MKKLKTTFILVFVTLFLSACQMINTEDVMIKLSVNQGKNKSGTNGVDKVYEVGKEVVIALKVTKKDNSTKSGDGFIYYKSVRENTYYILTSANLVADSKEIIVTNSEGIKFIASEVGSDNEMDIGLISIESKEELKTADFGISQKVGVGVTIVAVGMQTTEDYAWTLNTGAVAALAQKKPKEEEKAEKFWQNYYMQTTIKYEKYSDGTPLFNIRGELVGIIKLQIGDAHTLALEADQFLYAAESILQGKEHTYFDLGYKSKDIIELTIDERKEYSISNNIKEGVLITELNEDSIFAKAGVEKGMIIKQFSQNKVKSQYDIMRTIIRYESGATVQIKLMNADKQEYSYKIKLQ